MTAAALDTLIPATPAPGDAASGDPSEEAWKLARARPIRGSELRLELGMTAAFLAMAIPLALTALPVTGIEPIVLALVPAFAIAALVEFPIAGGSFTPTQLMLVPLFVVAPAPYVPLLAFAGFLLGVLIAHARREQALDRTVFCAGDAMHSLGPALVITVLASGDAAQSTVLVVLLAFGAQLFADFASASVHELLSIKAVPGEHVRVMLRIWGVDLALTTVGILAAGLAVDAPLMALAPLPLVLLLGRLAADRMQRIDDAKVRTVALELEQNRRQTALEQLERQVSFLQDVSHELRTPVTIARGHLDNARRAGSRPELGVALDELGRIDRMIERLLMMARAEQPELMDPRPLDAESFLEDRFVRWSDTVGRNWRLEALASGVLTADEDALTAALDALIENAIKHTTPGQMISLESRLERGALVIEVTDGGSGIPPEALGQIFDRFGQADASSELRQEGTGLGLAMVNAVATAHGGSCAVESSPAGSCFSLRVPSFEPLRAEGNLVRVSEGT